MALLRSALVLGLVGACGMGGEEGGGDDNLPTLGAGPYGKLEAPAEGVTPAIEPFVVTDNVADLADPEALPLGGGAFRLWFTRTEPGAMAEIWRADLPAVTELPDPAPARALAATEAWEGGWVGAPSVVDRGGGRLAMYYQGAGGIGRADSTDRGETWSKVGLVLADGADPGAIEVGGRTYLYYTRADAGGIFLAESQDGVTFVPRADPVIVRRDTDADAFDRLWVGEPEPVGGVTAAGQVQIGLFFTGRATEGATAIGYAGSYDGREFTRFFNDDAILEPGLADESDPAVVLEPAHGTLFFTQLRAQTTAIAVAVHP